MKNRVAFWSTLPLVVPQAVRLRRRALRLPPPPGPAAGHVGSGRSVRLLAVGDSIAAGVGARSFEEALVGRVAAELAERLGCEIRWRAVGQSGATSSEILDRIVSRLDAEPADIILLTTGVNDITALLRSASYRKNLARLLDGLAGHSPRATIAILGVPPLELFPLLPEPLRRVLALRGRTFDEIARDVAADRPQALHVPIRIEAPRESFAEDGFHPSATGYRRLGAAAAARIVAALRERGLVHSA